MLRSIVFLVLGLITLSQGTLPAEYEDSEAYRVYAAILPTEWTVTANKAKRLIIQEETRAYPMCLRPEKRLEALVGPAIAEYTAVNSHPWRLQPMFSLALPYKLITGDEIHAAFDLSGGWDGFYRHYPDSGGYIELSAVGFNPEKSVAVVYEGHHCGSLCGGGSFQVLEKKDGNWLPLDWKGESCAWAS